MKLKLLILFIILSTTSCKKKDTNIKYPFGYNLSEFTLDSTNNYGAGDCWSKVHEYSKNQIRIGIDSTICSEYGFKNSYYLIKNNKLNILHTQESSTILEDNVYDNRYIIKELIYSFQNNKSLKYSKLDTLKNNNFKNFNIGNSSKFYENLEFNKSNLLKEYYNTWKYEEEN